MDDGDIFSPFDEDEVLQDQDKSIADIRTLFFTEQETIDYLAGCEKNFNIQKKIVEHKGKKPKDAVKLITDKQLLAHLRKIVSSHPDDLDWTLWTSLSTRLLVAFYLQNDQGAIVKVLTLHALLVLKNNICYTYSFPSTILKA
jgi:hypothetical protein